jgi:hypothetical protein
VDRGAHELAYLLRGVRKVGVIEDNLAHGGPLPPLALRRRKPLGVHDPNRARYGFPRGDEVEDAPDRDHLGLVHDVVVPIIGVGEAVHREPARDDLALAGFLDFAREGAPGDLLTLPLREIVLHAVAYPVAGVVQGLERNLELLEVPLREKPVEPGAKKPVALDGPYDVDRP